MCAPHLPLKLSCVSFFGMTEGIRACLGCTSHNSPDNLSGARRRPYRLTAAGSCHCSGWKYVLPV